MQFLEPWFANSDSRLVAELLREMEPGHVLENLDLSIVANRRDCDEFLYAINDGSGRLAAVHLTWSKEREEFRSFPEPESSASSCGLSIWKQPMPNGSGSKTILMGNFG